MTKTVFMFTGQGAQYTGMGKDLCENFAVANEVYEKASNILGFDVLKLSTEGTLEQISATAVSQPLIYTLSMAAFEVLKANGIVPQAVAGFSLGECSALTAAGAMTLKIGLNIIKERAAAMQRAAENASGAMYAILGAEQSDIEQICADTEGYVIPVNYNCPGQIVIAGEADAAENAAKALADKGAKTVKLAVNSAFHSAMMQKASEEFFDAVKGFDFGTPTIPVYSNATGGLLETSDICTYLKTQMTSPVRFIDEMAAMSADGYTRFIELGPGKTLCGFIRKTLKGAEFANVEDMKTVEKALLMCNS
jgi:[acyl-carrier-protein] S-malonyltransferase